jgi:hypothetical protein
MWIQNTQTSNRVGFKTFHIKHPPNQYKNSTNLRISFKMARQMECERLHKALYDCHRRVPAGTGRETACRHLNRALAECMVAVVCPDESEAVRSLCSSGGTKLKRSQCQEAQLALSVCLSSHQQEWYILCIMINKNSNNNNVEAKHFFFNLLGSIQGCLFLCCL